MGQRAWFLTVKRLRTSLDQQSKALREGKTYSELRQHFIVGSDEEGVQANFHGKKLVGRKGKKMHVYNSDDSKTSGTVLRTGSAAGVKGPSLYILGGAKKPDHTTNNLWKRNGAPNGSMLAANPRPT